MIISIKSSSSGGSSRGLVHYLAHSKLNREKEGIERREFFNESENDLDVSRANQHLSLTDAKPKPEELLHVVVAPSKEEIESAGVDRKAQKDALIAVVRGVVAELQKQTKATRLKWVAVAHFNTDHPHAHVAVQKQFINENGRSETLRINRQMLHYNERGEAGEKKLCKGTLILAAENTIETIARERRMAKENQKKSESEIAGERSKDQIDDSKQISSGEALKIANYDERRTLAEEMLVAAEIARRTRNIENLIEHGDKKRFKIKDERTGDTRHISLFDIERKIETICRRKAQSAHLQNSEKRAELAARVALEMHDRYEPVTRQLETIRRHVLGFENRHLNEAQEKHTRLHNQRLLIEKKYEQLKMAVPLPIFEPDEIQRLQSEAIREQNLEKITLFENIRQNNAKEFNRPSRRDRDLRELQASKIIASLKLKAAEKRLRDFSENKDFIKVKIGSSIWSRRQIEQHELQTVRKDNLWTQVKSKPFWGLLFRPDKKTQASEKSGFPALRKAVSDALEELEKTRSNEVAKQTEFNQTLGRIIASENNPNKNNLAPAFSAFELGELEDLSNETGREQLFEKSLRLQENWLREKLAEKISQANAENELKISEEIKIQKISESNAKTKVNFQAEDGAQSANEKIIGDFLLSRAEARKILAQTKASHAEEDLARYSRDKLFVKHRMKDPKTGRIGEFSLRDVEPQNHYYLLDRILEKAFETKEQKIQRDVLQQAAREKEKKLTQNLEDAKNLCLRLEDQKKAIREKFSSEGDFQPIFTPKEIAVLQARGAQTSDKSEAERLEKIVNYAEKNNRVERLQNLLERAPKQMEIPALSLSKIHESKIPDRNYSTEHQPAISEGREISIRSEALETSLHAEGKSTEIETVKHEKTAVKEKGRTR